MSIRSFIIAVTLGIALSLGIFTYVRVAQESAKPTTATVLADKTPVPEFSLLDQDGTAIDESVFRGQWDLVFFGFTNCPDICPLTLKVLSDAKKQLVEAGHEPLPRIVLVSVDPERDTPAKLANYLRIFGESNLGITGELEEIRKLTGGLYIFFEKQETDSEFYSVDHSAVVLLIDPEGRLSALFSSPHAAQNFTHDVPLLTRQ